MSASWKLLVALLAAAAVAAPVAAIGGGGSSSGNGDVSRQSATWFNAKREAGKNWKPITDVTSTLGFLSVTVSAQMTKGKAKFRIVPVFGGPAIEPGPVLFSAKAANSFTWGKFDTCGQGEQHELQWKRVGKGDAVAANLSVNNVFDSLCV
jgi:hypothetical protein